MRKRPDQIPFAKEISQGVFLFTFFLKEGIPAEEGEEVRKIFGFCSATAG